MKKQITISREDAGELKEFILRAVRGYVGASANPIELDEILKGQGPVPPGLDTTEQKLAHLITTEIHFAFSQWLS